MTLTPCHNPNIFEVDSDMPCDIFEKSYARNIMCAFGDDIVSKDGAINSNYVVAENYTKVFGCTYEDNKRAEALQHWLEYAYCEDGKIYFKLSKHIL